MPSIAIVDDRKDSRETLSRVVSSTLKKLGKVGLWTVASIEPPKKQHDVLHWLDENDATVLVTDWKLNEAAKNRNAVNYEADSLIREIRQRRPNFPIFVVTGFEKEARSHLKDVEGIFTRDGFTNSVEDLLPQMIRAGQRRYDEQRKLLEKVEKLSKRVASGKATAQQLQELRSLQGFFQSELPTIINLDAVLTELEKVKGRADGLRAKMEKRLQVAQKGKKS